MPDSNMLRRDGAAAPASILIVRLSAIGDVIMASAVIPALREAYPHARLAWLTDETNAGLLHHNPRLDRLFVWPRARWRQLRREGRYREWLGEARELARGLRAERFDWVLDMQGLLKSGIWSWLAGGKLRIGLGSREGSQRLMHRVIDRRTVDRRIGGEYLKLVRALGVNPIRFPMDIVPSDADGKEADALLESAGVSGPYAVICPFTTRPQKHWFRERWAELSSRLARDLGLQVVMLGGPADVGEAEVIAGEAPGLANLAGRTGLGQCAALIRNARLLIGVDTGLTHLGTAMETPTLALFGSTWPYLDTAFAYGRVLYEPMDCAPCRKTPTCEGRFDCMRAHTVDRVMAAADALLSSIIADTKSGHHVPVER